MPDTSRWDDSLPTHRAARSFVESTLPPQGRHVAEYHDVRTTVRGGDGGSIIIPARAVPSAELTGNVVEVKLAENVQREGSVQAAEGLAQRDGHGVEDMFAGGFQQARAQRPGANFVEAKLANGRSGLADGHDSGNPAWTTDVQQNFGVLMGVADSLSGQQPGNIPALRPGSTPFNHTDLSRLDLSERGRTSYGKVYGSDAKLPRHNEAEVRD